MDFAFKIKASLFLTPSPSSISRFAIQRSSRLFAIYSITVYHQDYFKNISIADDTRFVKFASESSTLKGSAKSQGEKFREGINYLVISEHLTHRCV